MDDERQAAVPGTVGAVVLPMCSHPELVPTRWNQPRPEPCRMVAHCECGENASCPVCGFGHGSYPCKCHKQNATNHAPTERSERR